MSSSTDDSLLSVTRWPSTGPAVVLRHAGVADRRSWDAVADLLDDDGFDVVAYDRRGYGDTPAATDPSSFTHVDDLIALLDALALDRVLLVGNSMGGALALDAALLHPERISGAVLICAAVSGMTDDDTPFDCRLGASRRAHRRPGRDGRRSDRSARPLVARRARCRGGPGRRSRPRALREHEPPDPRGRRPRLRGRPRGRRVGPARRGVRAGAVCSWGALDLPCDIPFYEETGRRIGQGPAQVLRGVAHLPGLEQPDLVAALIRDASTR